MSLFIALRAKITLALTRGESITLLWRYMVFNIEGINVVGSITLAYLYYSLIDYVRRIRNKVK